MNVPRNTTAGVVSAMALMLSACGARVVQPVAPRPDTVRTEQPARGVSYEYRWYGSEPWAVHAVTVDPRACGIELRTMKAQDRVVGRETTSSMARRAAEQFGRPVLVAVNADFFSFDPPGVSEGPQLSNSVLIKSEGTHREALEDRLVRLSPVFAFDRNQRAWLTHTRLRASARAGGMAVPLAGINIRTRADATVVFDKWFGDATPTDTGALELVVRSVLPTAATTRRGVVLSVDTGAAGVPIPRDGFVMAARGTTRGTLTAVVPGDTVMWQCELR